MKKWIIGILVALALLVAGGLYVVYSSVNAAMDSYAAWDTALVIIHHMEKHDGAWPQDWEELEATCATTPGLMGPGWENLRERIEIDWSADPRKLAEAEFREDEPPFKVVRLRNGSSVHWAGAEPNTLILEYLKERDRATADTEPAVLIVNDEKRIEQPTDVQIREALTNFGAAGDMPFAVLQRSEMTYLQVAGDESSGFILEYQEGSVDSHYRATNEQIPLAEVIEAFIAYRHGNDDWKERFTFEKASR